MKFNQTQMVDSRVVVEVENIVEAEAGPGHRAFLAIGVDAKLYLW